MKEREVCRDLPTRLLMKNNLILILKGFVLGIANIIPGVSGGTLAITLGIYEKLIETISHFKDKIKENFKFLLFLVIGVAIALLVFSNVVSFCLDKYPFATILFFIGIILGGVPKLFNKIKTEFKISNLVIGLITFAIVIAMTFLNTNDKVISLETLNIFKIITLFFSGVIASASMLLPGISGSFVLMLIGYYKPIIDSIKDLTRFNNLGHNVVILLSMGLGIIVGIVCAAKLIEWLLKKYEIPTYYGIVGFVIASIISIFISALSYSVGVVQVIVGILLLIVGIMISRIIGDK